MVELKGHFTRALQLAVAAVGVLYVAIAIRDEVHFVIPALGCLGLGDYLKGAGAHVHQIELIRRNRDLVPTTISRAVQLHAHDVYRSAEVTNATWGGIRKVHADLGARRIRIRRLRGRRFLRLTSRNQRKKNQDEEVFRSHKSPCGP